jgi:NADH-quinone oxidoreductase subunit M
MNESILLPLLVLLPTLAGVGLLFVPRGREVAVRWLALATTVVAFLIGVAMCLRFDWNNPGDADQLAVAIDWIRQFGITLRFGVDSISLWLVMLTTFLMPVTVLGSFSAVKKRHREFFMWLLVLQGAMTGVFVARDIIFFYICFELTLIPLYFLIGIFGSDRRLWASKKFVIFTLTGSLLTFAGVVYVAWVHAAQHGGQWSFAIAELTHTAMGMPAEQQAWVLGALLAGFAVKVPLFPVHTWLPLAHTEAPTSGSVILAGT